MLFNSLPFLFGFLPATLIGFFVFAKFNPRLAALWLALGSVFFYGWWNASFVTLLIGSVVLNYCAGALITREMRKAPNYAHIFLAGGIAVDLCLLGYFKYASFFADIVGTALGMPLALATITLPLGISFFTFTQIAFLVDSYQGKVGDYDFLHYLLFVTYFPHLIAGPIIHHKQVMPQFANRKVYAVDWSNCAAGLTVLIIGLIKKVLVADNYGLIATPIFELADHGGQLRFATAWAGSIAYSLQLYFDFSGYSDMAIGLSLMFNIRLPLNFNSPYKAESIIDFWKRWHMTLSAFLRDYLYIPLGGNRRGEARRYLNLLVTMLLGGLWHGAGWTFVLWGALHGIYLVVNHGFRAVAHTVAWKGGRFGAAGRFAATGLTFACVVVGWTIFRADRIATALSMVKSMVVGCASAQCASIKVFEFATAMDARIAVSLWLAGGLAAVWLLPNTQEFLFRSGVSVPQALFGLGSAVRSPIGRLKWNPVWWCWVPLGIAAAIVVISIAFNPTSQFLYYQF